MNKHDLRAEMAVVGACIIDGQGIALARQFTAPAHFYNHGLREAFEAILRLADQCQAVDLVTLAAELQRIGKLDEVGGSGALAEAINAAQHTAYAGDYAKIVARYHFEREIALAAQRLTEDQDNPKHLEAIQSLSLARNELNAPAMFDYATSLHDFLAELADPKQEPVYKFGLRTLDNITEGLKKGEVNTFGAATNQGKSLLLLNLLDLQAQAGARCLFVGSEMTARETVARHLSIRSGLAAWKIRLPKLSPEEFASAQTTVADKLYPLPVQILDDPEPTLERIQAAVIRGKPDFLFVDYLERMSLPHAENLRLAVKEFMRRLKTMARKQNVVIFLASQLNRRTYGAEGDAPPTLADLSESSAIEKESDRVFLIWKPKMLQPEPGRSGSVMEIIKAKDRHGPNGLKAHLELDGRTLCLREVKNPAGAIPQ